MHVASVWYCAGLSLLSAAVRIVLQLSAVEQSGSCHWPSARRCPWSSYTLVNQLEELLSRMVTLQFSPVVTANAAAWGKWHRPAVWLSGIVRSSRSQMNLWHISLCQAAELHFRNEDVHFRPYIPNDRLGERHSPRFWWNSPRCWS